ncbi:MAG: hypothetical protein CMI30_11125 [Opitutae bacterium]|nr:hypothetical protein [Opitutae bacterium]|tara:strand:- start:22147 stop:22620 length:474 start_codon:yes stop_codon:yes gene_type:complete
MLIFRSLAILCVLSGLAISSQATEARFVSIRYLEKQAFLRISEYFDGKENKGSRLICRSKPESRAGLYLILSLKDSTRKLPPDLVARWQVIAPTAPDAVEHRVAVPNDRTKGKDLFVGLTGSDWPDPKARPVAWKFTLETADGKVVLERKSFLWERP